MQGQFVLFGCMFIRTMAKCPLHRGVFYWESPLREVPLYTTCTDIYVGVTCGQLTGHRLFLFLNIFHLYLVPTSQSSLQDLKKNLCALKLYLAITYVDRIE